jgi:hypothetical protein
MKYPFYDFLDQNRATRGVYLEGWRALGFIKSTENAMQNNTK